MSISACSQNASNKIIGNWLYKGTENNMGQGMECPDLLVFNTDGNYSILNDCYGDDIKSPIVEQGKWVYDSKEKKITLKDRIYSTNYTFHHNTPVLTLYVKEGTAKLLKLCFNQGNCIAENYEKISDGSKVENYSGSGSTTKKLQLTGKETALKLSYEFYKEPDELIIYDQNGKELHRTSMRVTTKNETVTINLSGIIKLIFKIESKDMTSKWKFSVEVK